MRDIKGIKEKVDEILLLNETGIDTEEDSEDVINFGIFPYIVFSDKDNNSCSKLIEKYGSDTSFPYWVQNDIPQRYLRNMIHLPKFNERVDQNLVYIVGLKNKDILSVGIIKRDISDHDLWLDYFDETEDDNGDMIYSLKWDSSEAYPLNDASKYLRKESDNAVESAKEILIDIHSLDGGVIIPKTYAMSEPEGDGSELNESVSKDEKPDFNKYKNELIGMELIRTDNGSKHVITDLPEKSLLDDTGYFHLHEKDTGHDYLIRPDELKPYFNFDVYRYVEDLDEPETDGSELNESLDYDKLQDLKVEITDYIESLDVDTYGEVSRYGVTMEIEHDSCDEYWDDECGYNRTEMYHACILDDNVGGTKDGYGFYYPEEVADFFIDYLLENEKNINTDTKNIDADTLEEPEWNGEIEELNESRWDYMEPDDFGPRQPESYEEKEYKMGPYMFNVEYNNIEDGGELKFIVTTFKKTPEGTEYPYEEIDNVTFDLWEDCTDYMYSMAKEQQTKDIEKDHNSKEPEWDGEINESVFYHDDEIPAPPEWNHDKVFTYHGYDFAVDAVVESRTDRYYNVSVYKHDIENDDEAKITEKSFDTWEGVVEYIEDFDESDDNSFKHSYRASSEEEPEWNGEIDESKLDIKGIKKQIGQLLEANGDMERRNVEPFTIMPIVVYPAKDFAESYISTHVLRYDGPTYARYANFDLLTFDNTINRTLNRDFISIVAQYDDYLDVYKIGIMTEDDENVLANIFDFENNGDNTYTHEGQTYDRFQMIEAVNDKIAPWVDYARNILIEDIWKQYGGRIVTEDMKTAHNSAEPEGDGSEYDESMKKDGNILTERVLDLDIRNIPEDGSKRYSIDGWNFTITNMDYSFRNGVFAKQKTYGVLITTDDNVAYDSDFLGSVEEVIDYITKFLSKHNAGKQYTKEPEENGSEYNESKQFNGNILMEEKYVDAPEIGDNITIRKNGYIFDIEHIKDPEDEQWDDELQDYVIPEYFQVIVYKEDDEDHDIDNFSMIDWDECLYRISEYTEPHIKQDNHYTLEPETTGEEYNESYNSMLKESVQDEVKQTIDSIHRLHNFARPMVVSFETYDENEYEDIDQARVDGATYYPMAEYIGPRAAAPLWVQEDLGMDCKPMPELNEDLDTDLVYITGIYTDTGNLAIGVLFRDLYEYSMENYDINFTENGWQDPDRIYTNRNTGKVMHKQEAEAEIDKACADWIEFAREKLITVAKREGAVVEDSDYNAKEPETTGEEYNECKLDIKNIKKQINEIVELADGRKVSSI